MDPSVGVAEDEDVRRWLLSEDRVLVRAVANAVGMDGLSTLVRNFGSKGEWLQAAKVEWACAAVKGTGFRGDGASHSKAALEMIEELSLIHI